MSKDTKKENISKNDKNIKDNSLKNSREHKRSSKVVKIIFVFLILLLIFFTIFKYTELKKYFFSQDEELNKEKLLIENIKSEINSLDNKITFLDNEVKKLKIVKKDDNFNQDRIDILVKRNTVRLNNLEKSFKLQQKFLILFADLKDAILNGKSFKKELDNMNNILSENYRVQLKKLSPYSVSGIPSISKLMLDFSTLSNQVAKKSMLKGETIKDRIMNGLKSLVTVKKQNYYQGDDEVLIVLSNIEKFMINMELNEVLKESKKLENFGVNDLNLWSEKVKISLLAREVLKSLESFGFNSNDSLEG